MGGLPSSAHRSRSPSTNCMISFSFFPVDRDRAPVEGPWTSLVVETDVRAVERDPARRAKLDCALVCLGLNRVRLQPVVPPDARVSRPRDRLRAVSLDV